MKNFFKVVANTSSFKKSVLIAIITLILLVLFSIIFDKIWHTENFVPLTDYTKVYMPPVAYDNISRINLKFEKPDKLLIECNKRFTILDSTKQSDYYDTVKLTFPEPDKQNILNKIYLKIEDSQDTDSIYIMISRSEQEDINWKQIFLSTVEVKNINRFSSESEDFRIVYSDLLQENALLDNDSIINDAVNYFNAAKDTLELRECGYNSNVFKKICDRFNLPSRIITLQGGDALFGGLEDRIGYPLHALCEVYSSKRKKWYVIDPTYGLRFRENGTDNYLSAIEISNRYFFSDAKDVEQDSILFTKNNIMGRDYFKYFENIYYNRLFSANKIIYRVLKLLYPKGDFFVVQHSYTMTLKKNYYYYFILKTFGFLVLIAIHFNFMIFLTIKSLYLKKISNK